ncbi:MAG TPA: hypothetical protein VK112_07845 [Fodinibius sp.]|nr:hypothetical protein [Fodinibius sp.]
MYITNHNRQIALIREMRQLRRDTQKCEVYYHHPFSNQMWKSFFPCSDGNDLGPKLLRHEPVPTEIEKNLEICLSEDDPENAIGLGIEWSTKTHLWPKIIQVLERRYSKYLRGQLKLFLEYLKMGELQIPEESDEAPQEEIAYSISNEQLNNLIWRSRKVRMKRFFVFG